MAEERVRRRLAAILAADVVGYSRLMESDETGTLQTLKDRRSQVLDPLVIQHRGRIFKVTGDGVLIEFTSAVDAVECAVRLQQDMTAASSDMPEDRAIMLRIGICLGDIIVEGGDLYGLRSQAEFSSRLRLMIRCATKSMSSSHLSAFTP
jgi:class 3 adenylate cyclase